MSDDIAATHQRRAAENNDEPSNFLNFRFFAPHFRLHLPRHPSASSANFHRGQRGRFGTSCVRTTPLPRSCSPFLCLLCLLSCSNKSHETYCASLIHFQPLDTAKLGFEAQYRQTVAQSILNLEPSFLGRGPTIDRHHLGPRRFRFCHHLARAPSASHSYSTYLYRQGIRATSRPLFWIPVVEWRS